MVDCRRETRLCLMAAWLNAWGFGGYMLTLMYSECCRNSKGAHRHVFTSLFISRSWLAGTTAKFYLFIFSSSRDQGKRFFDAYTGESPRFRTPGLVPFSAPPVKWVEVLEACDPPIGVYLFIFFQICILHDFGS